MLRRYGNLPVGLSCEAIGKSEDAFGGDGAQIVQHPGARAAERDEAIQNVPVQAPPCVGHSPMLPQPLIELRTQLLHGPRCGRRRGRHRGDGVGTYQVIGEASCDGH